MRQPDDGRGAHRKRMRAAMDDLLKGRVDCGEHDRQLGEVTRQIMMPHPTPWHPDMSCIERPLSHAG